MSVLADRIEKFILTKLLEEQESIVILQRNELADELECAPSQISYVLSTRFSNDRGFLVESRRGLGGFIRITRIQEEDENLPALQERRTNTNYNNNNNSNDDNPLGTIGKVDDMLYRLISHHLLTKREAALMHEAYSRLFSDVDEKKRNRSIHALYSAMIDILREE